LAFTSSRGNPVICFGLEQKNNGEDYYEYLFVYNNNILAIGVDPKDILMKRNKFLKLQPDTIDPPHDYFGT
jgi:hypothetical protein